MTSHTRAWRAVSLVRWLARLSESCRAVKSSVRKDWYNLVAERSVGLNQAPRHSDQFGGLEEGGVQSSLVRGKLGPGPIRQGGAGRGAGAGHNFWQLGPQFLQFSFFVLIPFAISSLVPLSPTPVGFLKPVTIPSQMHTDDCTIKMNYFTYSNTFVKEE